eukprot:CAMPEP_0174937646 /NCGR_PEP_ID=MMETSP1355-20121228/61101_1 /TAXON_ID=464990 /ORGANISM="Hemiselmis tepida, Strain CCMP443" /LENGTH=67 /DNA_ID=CAMNT_0016184505 /DNA_START=238 /DNA_END=438 /DNA_ORIENTATION=+
MIITPGVVKRDATRAAPSVDTSTNLAWGLRVWEGAVDKAAALTSSREGTPPAVWDTNTVALRPSQYQ